MVFYLEDFTREAQDMIKDNFDFNEQEVCAAIYFKKDTENCFHVSGTWDKIQKIILVLKEMEYDDFHLYYEDADIWTLYYHNPDLDNLSWRLIEY